MEIRPATDRDADEILRLLVQVNNVHSDNRPDLFLRDKTKYTKEELLAILKDADRPIFVADDGTGVVLGYAFCEYQSHEKDNNFPDIVTLYIDDICVDDAHRKQHVGSAIFDYVKAYAAEHGIYNLTLNVWDKNEAAMKFYEKCGFHIQKYGMEIIL